MSALIRRLALAAALYLGANMAHAGSWTDLWITRDQQGQRLLDQRQPAQAAQLFTDSRRRGYAELAAGHYAEAARLLAPYKDPNSQYNRGNALAHTGKLEEALDAFNAALSTSPGNRDIIKNRDLVEQALKRQSRGDQHRGGSQPDGQGSGPQGAQQSSEGKSKSGNQPGNQGQPMQRQGGNQPPGNSQSASHESPSQHSGSNHNPTTDQQAQSLSAQRPSQPADGLSHPGQPQSGRSTAGSASVPPPHAGNQTGQFPRTGTGATVAASPDRNTVQREIADTLQSEHGKSATAAPQPRKPRSEEALALDQWLRSIPDDSGELLQRKFMIEHLMRQRGNEP
jgi:Ca-activated chloride channel family protein